MDDERDHGPTEGDDRSAPDERLQEVGERIEQARSTAGERLGDPERTFVESGDQRSEEQDDQTIAPPG